MKNDAISRAWLLEQLQDLGNTTLLKRNFIALVENAPAVDDVKIVRCKDCRSFEKGRCLIHCVDVADDSFCSCGKEAEHG